MVRGALFYPALRSMTQGSGGVPLLAARELRPDPEGERSTAATAGTWGDRRHLCLPRRSTLPPQRFRVQPVTLSLVPFCNNRRFAHWLCSVPTGTPAEKVADFLGD